MSNHETRITFTGPGWYGSFVVEGATGTRADLLREAARQIEAEASRIDPLHPAALSDLSKKVAELEREVGAIP